MFIVATVGFRRLSTETGSRHAALDGLLKVEHPWGRTPRQNGVRWAALSRMNICELPIRVLEDTYSF